MTTTMPVHVLNRTADITESDLKSQDIFHIRNGTKFIVKMSDEGKLIAAQIRAVEQLMSEGVITPEMAMKEMSSFFRK